MSQAADAKYDAMTVDLLKTELRARGLPLSGKKSDLIARLQQADDAPANAALGEKRPREDAGDEGTCVGFAKHMRPFALCGVDSYSRATLGARRARGQARKGARGGISAHGGRAGARVG